MASPPRTSRRSRAVALAAALTTGAAGAVLLAPATSSASSHREAPAISGDARADNTDVYAFVSPDAPDTVTLVASWWPFEEPDGGPNFYRFADDGTVYDINIDSNGDSQPDLTYRWTFSSTYRTTDTFLYNTGPVTSFDDENLNFRQTYDLTRIVAGGATTTVLDDAPVAPSNTGPASFPDYAAVRADTIRNVGSAGKSFAGQSDDAFFLDLRVFDLLYGADLSEVGQDTLDGYSVQTVALQLPKSDLALGGDATNNPVIGVWSTTSRPTQRVLPDTDAATFTPTFSGGLTQVSRLGQPLVNEVVIPLRDKDQFNASKPVDDAGDYLGYVQSPEVPRLLNAIYGLPIPDSDPGTAGVQREDLVEVFLTGVCTAAKGCPGGVPALEADLNSQLLNRDRAATFVPSEMLRLNMGVPPTASPNRLGVLAGDNAGFPNGRRLTDDVIDIALKAVAGALLGADTDVLSDAVDSNDVPFSATFPYVAVPAQQAVNRS